MVKINELKDGYYLIRKKGQRMFTYPRYYKNQLREEIDKRRWLEEELEVIECDMEFEILYKKSRM